MYSRMPYVLNFVHSRGTKFNTSPTLTIHGRCKRRSHDIATKNKLFKSKAELRLKNSNERLAVGPASLLWLRGDWSSWGYFSGGKMSVKERN